MFVHHTLDLNGDLKRQLKSSRLNGILYYIIIFLYREPIKCGDVIRLQHLQTRLFLHSHFFQSPLSQNQEVSCFGDGTDTGGDESKWK